MNTPPPTETPAPLSEADIQLSIDWLRGLAGKGGKGVVGNIDARGLGHIAEQLSALRARNEALEDALEAVKFYATETPEAVKRTAARLYQLKTPTEDEAAIVLDAANVILGQAGRIARHVAALQEIGKGVEADQATIARLSEELAQADAVIADEDGDVLMEDRILWRNQAIARHVARRSAGEGREG